MVKTASKNPEKNVPNAVAGSANVFITDNVGLTEDNQIVAAQGQFGEEVQSEMAKGISEEAAIGNIIMQEERKKRASLTSEPARQDLQQQKQDFQQMTTGISRADYIDEQSYQNALARSQGRPEPFASYAERTTKKPVEKPVEGEVVDYSVPGSQAVDEDIDLINSTYNSYLEGLDAFEQQQIQDIQREYAGLRREMQRTNEIMQETTKLAGARTGRQRYAPEIQSGILQAEINAGQQRISNLIQEEQSLINQAKRAMQEQRWGVFKDRLSMVRSAREEKSRTIQQHKDNILKQAQEERNKMEFLMNTEQHYTDIKQKNFNYNQGVASDLANSLITLNSDLEVVTPSIEEVAQIADHYGIEASQLMSAVQSKTKEYSEFGADQRSQLLEDQVKTLNIRQKQLQNEYDTATLPNRIANLILDTETKELNNERLALLNKKEAEMLPYELQLKKIAVEQGEVNIGKIKQEIKLREEEALQKSLANGELSLDQRLDLQKTDEFKGLESLKNLKTSILAYKQLVEKYGTAKFGPTQLNLLNGAYADVVTEWKEVKKLGALTGPDMGLAEDAIPRATPRKQDDGTYSMFGLGRLLGPINNNAILTQLDKALGTVDTKAVSVINQVSELDGGKYYQTGYMKEYIKPFIDQDIPTSYYDYNTFMTTGGEEAGEFSQMLNSMGINKNDEQAVTDAFEEYKQSVTGFNNDLSMSENGLGELSEKYESGGDPGAIGYDSTGGWSYGAYQLAHNNAKKFIDNSIYKDEFDGITFNSEQWRNKWKEIAQKEPDMFKQAQKEYIGMTHYQPQAQKIENETSISLGDRSPVLRDVVWSTAVQHGANTDVVINAINKVGKDGSDEDIIREIYNERWSGGKRFARSTQNIKNSVYNRFFGANGELNQALDKLS